MLEIIIAVIKSILFRVCINTLFFGKIVMVIQMLYYLNSFYLYSFFGFLLELCVKTFVFHRMNSGILYGPWLPVYGFGAISVIFIMRFVFNRFQMPRWLKIICMFLLVCFFLSLIEYLGGILIEGVFHKTFWDYRDMKFSLGKYVSLEMALLWGVCSLLIIYVIKPLLDPFIKKIPAFVTWLVSFLFIIDVIFTFFLSH